MTRERQEGNEKKKKKKKQKIMKWSTLGKRLIQERKGWKKGKKFNFEGRREKGKNDLKERNRRVKALERKTELLKQWKKK